MYDIGVCPFALVLDMMIILFSYEYSSEYRCVDRILAYTKFTHHIEYYLLFLNTIIVLVTLLNKLKEAQL